jgi:signal transduction histidine kinase/ligand-binding sensor domain-containing protein
MALLALAATAAGRGAEAEAGDLDLERLQVWRAGDHVRAVAQTPDGFLWVGLRDGLRRFDGRQFEPVDALDPALAQPITALLAARDGALWVAVDAGVAALVLRIPPEGRPVRPWGRAQRLATREVRALVEDARGTVWAGGDGGIWKLPASGGAEGVATLMHPRLPVGAMHPARGGGSWVGTALGLARLSSDGARLEPVWRGPAVEAITELPGDPDHLHLGTDGALLRLRLPVERPDAPAEEPWRSVRLPHRRVSALLVDRERNLWVGTPLGLVQAPRARPFRVVRAGGGQVSAVVAAADGSWWNIDGAEFVVRRRGGDLQVQQSIDVRPVAPNGIVGMLEDPAGTLWVGSWEQGLFRKQGAQLLRVPLHGWETRDTVRPLLASPRRGLVLGIGDGMLATWSDGATRWQDLEGLGVRGELISAVEDGAGRLWLASEHSGLVVVDAAGKARRIGVAQGLPSENLTGLVGRPDGSLWIGSRDAGLIRHHGGRFTAITRRDGLGTDAVCAPFADGSGHLWLPTLQDGIVRAREAELVAFTEGRARRVSALMFSVKDGLPADGAPWRWTPLGARDRQGRLWLGMTRDAVVFPAPDAVVAPPVPQVLIERARVDGRDLPTAPAAEPAGEPARIPHGRSALEVRYTAALVDGRQHLRFRYRLDGLDPAGEGGWHEVGEAQEAQYAAVPPGSYRFRVAAFLDNRPGASEVREATVAFVLVPAFHRTRAFLVACAAALVAGLGLAYTVRLRLLRRRFAMISEERNRIAREIHDSLEQTLFAAKLQVEAAPEPQARAVALIQRAIEETRAAVWSLRTGVFGRADLSVAISVTAGEVLRATDVAFALRAEGTPYRLPAVTEWHIGQVVREAFTNALKHARARAVEVHLDWHPERLVVSVRDDGVGLPEGGVPAAGTGGGRYGLQGMRERLRPFGGRVTVASGDARGTVVTVEVPRPQKGERT